MRKLISSILFALPLITGANIGTRISQVACLPELIINERFDHVQYSFGERWNLFTKGKTFTPWQANKSREDLIKEFTTLEELRLNAWYRNNREKNLIANPDFIVAQDLLSGGNYRFSLALPFQYNRTDANYNSSSISLQGFKIIALEAPNEKTLRNFFMLLRNYNVNHLVRLGNNVTTEKPYYNYNSYWSKRTKIDNGTEVLVTPIYASHKNLFQIPYYTIENWQDDAAYAPEVILKTINKLRKNLKKDKEIIAIHCNGLPGRTGTFLAALILLDEIDSQLQRGKTIHNLELSVEKVVLELSLQRSFMVANAEQYIAIHKIIGSYLKSKSK